MGWKEVSSVLESTAEPKRKRTVSRVELIGADHSVQTPVSPMSPKAPSFHQDAALETPTSPAAREASWSEWREVGAEIAYQRECEYVSGSESDTVLPDLDVSDPGDVLGEDCLDTCVQDEEVTLSKMPTGIQMRKGASKGRVINSSSFTEACVTENENVVRPAGCFHVNGCVALKSESETFVL